MKKILPLLALVACSSTNTTSSQEAFFDAIKEHCGKAYLGKVVTDIPKGSGFDKKLVMHVRECTDKEIRIPFYVGEDRSRTWVISKTAKGLLLKHDHRHKDGTPDKSTMYGGHTIDQGTVNIQSFPADQFSKDMFIEQGIPVSVDNIWKLHIDKATFSYQLMRVKDNRNFKVDFDLTKSVPTPEAPWGTN